MYLLQHLTEVPRAEIAAILTEAPLACLVAHTDAGPIANHLLHLTAADGALIGHVALANDMQPPGRRGPAGAGGVPRRRRLLVAGLLPDQARALPHYRHVLTWNYQAVHVTGTIAFQLDECASAPARRRSPCSPGIANGG